MINSRGVSSETQEERRPREWLKVTQISNELVYSKPKGPFVVPMHHCTVFSPSITKANACGKSN